MTSYLSTLTDRLPSMETVSSYIPSKEDVTAGFGKVQDSASKAWKNTSETFSDGLERAKNSYEKLDPKTRKYLESSAIAAAVVSASALAYVNRENISNGASALVDSSREGYKAISDKVASLRKTETTEKVETKEEAFDLVAAQKQLAKLESAESRLTGRINKATKGINKATKDGNDKVRKSALSSRTQVRAQMKALAAKNKVRKSALSSRTQVRAQMKALAAKNKVRESALSSRTQVRAQMKALAAKIEEKAI